MAWYYGTYACGHQGRVNVIGKMSERQWKIDRHFGRICEECRKKEREEESKKAEEISKEFDFPDLQGTDKQIAWANTIRLDFYNLCNKNKVLVDDIIIHETAAKFWIDNRYNLNLDFPQIYNQAAKKRKREKEVISADSVKPENVKHDGVVEIVNIGNKIVLRYEKDQDFVDTVKSKKYQWDSWEKYWYRNLTETTGKFSDRAAEIGNLLLKNGFAICIHDPEITKKAIDGIFEEECARWIYSTRNTSLLAIDWGCKNDELYRKAKQIGAQWDGSFMRINVSHYKKVERFAEENNFKFTTAAKDKINDYKTQLESIKQVNVK